MNSHTRSLNALTGLRWLAAFTVFLHHAGGRFGLPRSSVPLGSLAVSFFFVLSGFILTYVYADRLKSSARSIGRFYFTRWARIWPLHVVCLILCLAVLTPANKFHDLSATGPQLVANVLLVQSWIPNDDWVFSFNGVSWSISTELFFYICFPLLLLGGARRFWFKLVAVWTIVLGILVTAGPLESLEAFSAVDFFRLGHVNPLVRLAEFATGMAVGHLFLRFPDARLTGTRWGDTILELGIVALICGWIPLLRGLGIMTFVDAMPFSGKSLVSWFRIASPVLPFALAIYVFARSGGWLARVLSSRGFVYLGEISFAFYMVHMMVIQFALRNWYFESITPGWMVAGAAALVSTGLSIVLFSLVEMPAKNSLLKLYDRQWRAAFAIWPREVATLATSPLIWLAVLLVGVPVVATTTFPRWPESVRIALYHPEQTENEITESSLAQSIKFADQVELLDYSLAVKPRGFELTLVWRKNAPLDHRRFIHYCDATGKPIDFGPRNDQLFAGTPVGQTFSETVFLPSSKIHAAAFVGVGFHRPGQGMLSVQQSGANVSTTLNCHRLTLLDKTRLEDLLAQQATRFPHTARSPSAQPDSASSRRR